MSAQPKSPQTGSLKRIYEHNQLFKLRLFADNLLTIQLFILRLRPSPSHKQMKSNKALLTNDIVEPERRRVHSHHTVKIDMDLLIQLLQVGKGPFKAKCNHLNPSHWFKPLLHCLYLQVINRHMLDKCNATSKTYIVKDKLVRDQFVKLQQNLLNHVGLFNTR